MNKKLISALAALICILLTAAGCKNGESTDHGSTPSGDYFADNGLYSNDGAVWHVLRKEGAPNRVYIKNYVANGAAISAMPFLCLFSAAALYPYYAAIAKVMPRCGLSCFITSTVPSA